MSDDDRILVVMSGGLDSTVLASWAVEEFGEYHVGAITFQYGQKNDCEIWSARAVAQALHLREHIIKDVRNLFQIPGMEHSCTLMEQSKEEIKNVSYDEIEYHDGPMPTYVPIRNPVFGTIACLEGMVRKYDQVWMGVTVRLFNTDVYPDCRPDVIGALSSALYIGSNNKIKLFAPFNYMTKAEIVALGKKIYAPMELSYSCYAGQEAHCGKCPACISRKEAFNRAKVRDPTIYQEE